MRSNKSYTAELTKSGYEDDGSDLIVKATWPAKDGQCPARWYEPIESGYDPGRCCLKVGHAGPHAADFHYWRDTSEVL